jgi:hypothetical protein
MHDYNHFKIKRRRLGSNYRANSKQNAWPYAHNKELAKYTEHASPFSHTSTEELAILALVKRLKLFSHTLTRFCFKGKTVHGVDNSNIAKQRVSRPTDKRTCENGPCTNILTTPRVK